MCLDQRFRALTKDQGRQDTAKSTGLGGWQARVRLTIRSIAEDHGTVNFGVISGVSDNIGDLWHVHALSSDYLPIQYPEVDLIADEPGRGYTTPYWRYLAHLTITT
jgi:hypothetical protein